MNENELKTRLQRDAERFSPSFNEELCKRIMYEFSMRPKPKRWGAHRRFSLQYVVLVCSSIFIGIGVWSLIQHHVSHLRPIPKMQMAVNSSHSDSTMNIMPSRVALSPNSTSISTPAPLQVQPSVSEAPNGTLFNLSVPKAQSLEELPKVLIPGLGLVRLSRHLELQPETRQDVQPENQLEPENHPASNFWNDATEVVRVPVGWILEE